MKAEMSTFSQDNVDITSPEVEWCSFTFADVERDFDP